MNILRNILFIVLSLSAVHGALAVDADSDGSDAVEETLAGTSDSDATQRPYWWKNFNGDSTGDELGCSVSDAGDVNNDGYGDVVIGIWQDDNTAANSGSARVMSGVDGSVLYTFNGTSANELFGHAVSGAGDVNNDSYDDVVVGSYSGTSAKVFSGANGSILYTFSGSGGISRAVSGAGDVNNDGYADVIVGGGGEFGIVRVYSGANGSILYDLDSYNGYFGYAVSDAGDVNNDGYGDFIVGAWKRYYSGSNVGAAYVFSGFDGGVLYTFYGDGSEDEFGVSVSNAGDVNGDGYTDLIVGARRDDNNGGDSGSARVFSGSDGSVLYTLNGDTAVDYFGMSVSGAGDVNGDGYADVIAGASQDDNKGSGSGSAKIFSGIDGSALYLLNGDGFDDRLGYSVSGAGDINGDGYADVVVGAYRDDNNGSSSGSARIILSSDLLNDVDADFYLNGVDDLPNDPYEWIDSDSDGTGDNSDVFPLDPTEWFDTDGDSVGNNTDADDDGDIIPDTEDLQPLIANAHNSDLNRDGVADILWRNETTKEMRSWTMAGNNLYTAISFLPQYSVGNDNWQVAAMGDIDADGDADIIWRNVASGYNRSWIMEKRPNGQEVYRETLTFFPQFGDASWSIVGAGDANGDGTEDLFFHNSSSGQLRIWEMDATGNRETVCFFSPQTIGYQPQAIDDFDGDGDADVFWRNPATHDNRVWRLQDCALANTVTLPNRSGGVAERVVGTGDFNHDHVNDLLWLNSTTGAQQLWGMVNGNRDSVNGIPAIFSGDVFSGIADYNGDGTDDILYYNPTDGYPRIWWMSNFTRNGHIRTPQFGAGGSWSVINNRDN